MNTLKEKKNKQKDFQEKSDEIVMNFFEELRPPKKGEAYTFLIPLMVELKCNLEEAVKQARAETLEEAIAYLIKKNPVRVPSSVMVDYAEAITDLEKLLKGKLK